MTDRNGHKEELKLRRKTPFLERRKTEGLGHVDGHLSILASFKFVYELHPFPSHKSTVTPPPVGKPRGALLIVPA